MCMSGIKCSNYLTSQKSKFSLLFTASITFQKYHRSFIVAEYLSLDVFPLMNKSGCFQWWVAARPAACTVMAHSAGQDTPCHSFLQPAVRDITPQQKTLTAPILAGIYESSSTSDQKKNIWQVYLTVKDSFFIKSF